MFETGRYSPRRRVDPPVAVLVDLRQLLPPARTRWGGDTPLWVRNHGIKVNVVVAGTLKEWILTEVGDWYGLCEFTVRVGRTDLTVTQLVPKAALRKKSQQPQTGRRETSW